MQYLILQNPGHNRVYYLSADKMALAELNIALLRLSISTKSTKIEIVKGIRYISFETETEVGETELDIISKLSFVFALYQVVQVNHIPYLKPIQLTDYAYLNTKISSLLKYPGKTNELFTKMMINVALLSSDFNYHDKINLLDPVAGKGTTLFEAGIYGFDAYGIETNAKAIHETTVFFKKYLETEHIKHTFEKRRIAGSNKTNAIQAEEFFYATTKSDFKNRDNQHKLVLINGNTTHAQSYFKQAKFQLLVGDLPYGIYHGNTTEKSGGTRNPYELLSTALPGWKTILRQGGTLVLAWNSFLVKREKLAQLFAENGFVMPENTVYGAFEHMVDKSIKRDIIVAKKVR